MYSTVYPVILYVWCSLAQYGVAWLSYGAAWLSVVRRGSVMERRGSVWCGMAQTMVWRGSIWCGVAQLFSRRLTERQARVLFSPRHHREVFPTELTSDEEMERGLGEWRWINILHECD
jgi:hypothetical protein